MIWIEAGLIGAMVTLIIILIGLRLGKPISEESINNDTQTDLDRKLIELADRKHKVKLPSGIRYIGYHFETDEYQRLLTHCFRIRLNKDLQRTTFIDVCDDFFLGFHTYAFDKEGRAAGDTFNAYGPEPTDTSECESELAPGEEIIAQPDQLNELR